MTGHAWMQVAGERLIAGDTSGVLQACVPEILSMSNVAHGYLLEVAKAAEDAEFGRLKRAVSAANPHLIPLHMAFIFAAGALTKAGRGRFEQREHTDDAVKVALGVDVSMRGERGMLLYHSRVAQSEAIQAMKLLAYFEKRHDERGSSTTAWNAFEAAVFLVADELDSIVFSFRVLTTLLDMM